MDPKYALIWFLPGLVLDAIGIQEYRSGRWRVSRVMCAVWMVLVLLFGPFMLIGLLHFRSRH